MHLPVYSQYLIAFGGSGKPSTPKELQLCSKGCLVAAPARRGLSRGSPPLHWCNSPGTPTSAYSGWAAHLKRSAPRLTLQGVPGWAGQFPWFGSLDRRPGAGNCKSWLHRPLRFTTHRRSDERIDKSIAPIHRGGTRCICASGVTACHSSLFTFGSGHSGLGFYTTQRDTANFMLF